MRFHLHFFFALIVIGSVANAQQLNSVAARLNVNGPIVATSPSVATPVIGVGPLETTTFLGTSNVIRVGGTPNMPLALIFGTYAPSSFVLGNIAIDIADGGGFYANQILVSGFSNGPAPAAAISVIGQYAISPTFTCPLGLATACAPFLPAVAALQAIVGAPANPPYFVQSSAASVISIFSGSPTNFTLTDDNSANYNFPPGFIFNFYGTNYTSCFVSANGFVSFGAVDTGFPAPTVAGIRAGVRRIMSFYEDLTPQVATAAYTTRIFAHSFIDNGMSKVRIVHENLAEFANSTGPHGGEIVLSQNGDIEIFMPPYVQVPAINTVVGITPGNNLDPIATGNPGQTAYGRDLSLDVATGPTPLGINRIGFELFDYSSFAILNPLDLVGFGYTPGSVYSPGITFIRNPLVTAANQAEYIVQ